MYAAPLRLTLILASCASAIATLSACDPEDMPPEPALTAQPKPGLAGPEDLKTPEPSSLVCGDTFDIDPRRSLAVTDEALLAGFTFERVMDQIVSTANEPGLTREALYGRWWDSQNTASGAAFPEAFHCDDSIIDGKESLGAFPIQCPRPEGALAFTDPFSDPDNNPDSYIPIGLFNRFDLARTDGSHCGEYRIVFAKRSGTFDSLNRNLIIFEAALPNPFPATRYHSLVAKRDTIPDCLELTAWTAEDEVMGLRHRHLPIHGVQFHPESILSEHGHDLLRNFLRMPSPVRA